MEHCSPFSSCCMEDFDPLRRCGRQHCRKRVREMTRKLLPRFVACSQAAAAFHAKGATTSFGCRLPLPRLPLCSPSPLAPPSRHLLPHCTAPSAHAEQQNLWHSPTRGAPSPSQQNEKKRMPVVVKRRVTPARQGIEMFYLQTSVRFFQSSEDGLRAGSSSPTRRPPTIFSKTN
jgi:hypothetical protein